MRVSGQGPGSSREGDRRPDDRAARFRRARRAGEILRGFVTHRETADLAWLEIDGAPLLARLPGNVPLGREVLLLVEALFPDITLRRLPDPDDQAAPRRLNLRV